MIFYLLEDTSLAVIFFSFSFFFCSVRFYILLSTLESRKFYQGFQLCIYICLFDVFYIMPSWHKPRRIFLFFRRLLSSNFTGNWLSIDTCVLLCCILSSLYILIVDYCFTLVESISHTIFPFFIRYKKGEKKRESKTVVCIYIYILVVFIFFFYDASAESRLGKQGCQTDVLLKGSHGPFSLSDHSVMRIKHLEKKKKKFFFLMSFPLKIKSSWCLFSFVFVVCSLLQTTEINYRKYQSKKLEFFFFFLKIDCCYCNFFSPLLQMIRYCPLI